MTEKNTRQDALNYVATQLAEQAVRLQVQAAQQTLEFLEQIDPVGDDALIEKVKKARDEVELISSPKFLRALEYLYAEVYNGLSDEHIIRFASDIEFDVAVNNVGALNAAKVGDMIRQLLDGTYVEPTIQ
ncbi:hypothetical protein CHUUTOTORO_01040 [Serratia phage vB_SmaM-ChuuTotoro]|nr:hypothetical protein CHUUTOTORO_01040 [Serratia phage vB_SmaM-ChuuTotoro]